MAFCLFLFAEGPKERQQLGDETPGLIIYFSLD
jgi:hypothetical protein